MIRDLEQDVIFRFVFGCREVLALWPAVPADNQGFYCRSYAHFGQHGAADYQYLLTKSRPATPEEYQDLLGELRRIGHMPNIIRRAREVHRQHRIGD